MLAGDGGRIVLSDAAWVYLVPAILNTMVLYSNLVQTCLDPCRCIWDCGTPGPERKIILSRLFH